jgi:hypothetical protein
MTPEQLAARAPVKYRGLYLRALRGELAPRQAIKVKCYECCAWERLEGGTDRIGGCTVRGCPLWPLRPFQGAAESSHVPEGEGSADEGTEDGESTVPATPRPDSLSGGAGERCRLLTR